MSLPYSDSSRLLLRRLTVAALLLGAPPLAAAGQEIARIPIVGAPAGTAALGGGLRLGESPYIASEQNEEIPLDLVPLYLYEGKWLFAHGTSGGVHLVDNDRFELSLLGRYRFQQLDPSKDPVLEGLERRRQSLDAGFTTAIKGQWGSLRFDGVTDTLGRHQGHELQVSYRYVLERGAWIISPFVTWGWQSDKLVNYYFGVSESEATAGRPAYETGDAQFVSFGLNTSWMVTDRILLFGNVGFGGLDAAIENSPIVERPSFNGAFVGGAYAFGNTLRPIAEEGRISEWSWRVNYGYQADGNIVSEIDQGDFSKSTVADTNIGGIMLSRLLSGGKRIDYLGRLAMYRHFEEGKSTKDGQFSADSDFWSWSAYIMAMGKGYGKWSGEEWFRWGFGFGMSYAQQVPLAEQGKQASKGGNTSRFLNYLEMQLDFPLRRVSKARWLQDCYAGVTIVHRSGIFGTSNILGDVSGGSDWITAHLECVR